MLKTKIPVLMYHEINTGNSKLPGSQKMTPAYNISSMAFEEQIKYLSANGYSGITFGDLHRISQHAEKKYIIVTFDDGWLGNYEIAFSILKKYNFKAVFFVTGDFVCKQDFMTWAHLEKLVDYGMLVQPHGLSHRPLQNLGSEELYRELYKSKKDIEEKLGISVFSMSFPHGSYSRKILDMGRELKYKIMCTSELKKIYIDDLLTSNSVVGRITITDNLSIENFIKFISYDRKIYFKYEIFGKLKFLIKSTIGIERYRKLYRAYYHIDNPNDG